MFGWLRKLFAPKNPYRDMRKMVLNTTPEEFNLKPTTEFPDVWGVLMEFCIGEATVTLVVMADGTASLYFSGGGGIIGGGAHREIVEAGAELLRVANRMHKELRPVSEFPLPKSGMVQFYLLTYSGVTFAKDRERKMDEQVSPLLPLYIAGHDVIAAIRETTGG